MDFVTPMVAVGAMSDALDDLGLQAKRIGAALSLSPVALDVAVAHHCLLEIKDRVALPHEAIAAAVAFIAEQVREGRRVLIHCEMGVSRSPSLAICYLHECCGMSIETAIGHVKSVRPSADPHPALIASIREYYGQCHEDAAWATVPARHCGAVSR